MSNVLLLVIIIALGIALAPYILAIIGGILSIALAVLALWVGFIAVRGIVVLIGRSFLVPVLAVRRTYTSLNHRLATSRFVAFIDRRYDNFYRRHPVSRGIYIAVYSVLVPGVLSVIAIVLSDSIHLLSNML